MDLKEFKAGSYLQQYQYKSFMPSLINHSWVWSDPKINTLLEEATHKLGALDAFSKQVPDVDYFIRMHVVKEATTSSHIEGTKTNVEEALLKAAEVDPERRDDWQEVQNYVGAMNHAIKRLRKIPVSTRLLKETHRILLTKGRGASKMPGEFRRSQNWIGGSTIKDATYVPPLHEEVNSLMSDLEKFLHNNILEVPSLIRIAICHYQFETIHPFLDGNGRIGRLLITLYLVSAGLLAKLTLYLSDYFDRHRLIYYDKLEAVRKKNDMIQWVTFFLVAIDRTCENGIRTFEKIQKLREDVEGKRLPKLGKRLPNARKLIMELYKNPRVTSADVVKFLGISPKASNELMQELTKINVLKEITGGRRNRIFIYHEYVKLFR